MAAATTSCQCGSSCVHSSLRTGSYRALCLHCHIWTPVNNKRRASPRVKTGMKRCPRSHVHMHTDTHARPLTCSSQAFKTFPICTQLSFITVTELSSRYANLEGWGRRGGFLGGDLTDLTQLSCSLFLLISVGSMKFSFARWKLWQAHARCWCFLATYSQEEDGEVGCTPLEWSPSLFCTSLLPLRQDLGLVAKADSFPFARQRPRVRSGRIHDLSCFSHPITH